MAATGICAVCQCRFRLRPGQARCSPKRKVYCTPECRKVEEKRRIYANYPDRWTKRKPHSYAAVLFPLSSSTDQGLFGGAVTTIEEPCDCESCEAYRYDPARQCTCSVPVSSGSLEGECASCQQYRQAQSQELEEGCDADNVCEISINLEGL